MIESTIQAIAHAWMNPDFAQRLAGSLLHFIWQGALIAMVAAITLRVLVNRPAEWRYGVSIAALALMLAAPVVTFVFYAQTGMATLKLLRLVGESMKSAAQSTTPTAATASWTQWIVLVWLIGVLIGSIRLIAGWRMSRSLLKVETAAVPSALQQSFNEVMGRLALAKPVRLLASLRIDTPVAVGWLRPAVLLPITALTGLSGAQLQAVFAHELAHIRRHDFLVNLLQRCVEAVLFYHPAVWWLSSRIRSERENCCDDLAVEICGDRSVYAQALIELERVRTVDPDLAVAATGGVLTRRIHRVLGYRIANADWQSAVAALLFVVVWVMVGVWQSDSTLEAKSFAPPPVPAQPIVRPEPSLPVAGAVSAIAAIVTAEPAPPVQSSTAVSTQTGMVEGILRDASGGSAPGARVLAVAVPTDPAAFSPELIFQAQAIAGTDSEGRYRLENIPAGSYFILAGSVGSPTFYPGTLDAGAGKMVTVSSGAAVRNVDFALASVNLGVIPKPRATTPPSSQTGPGTLTLNVSVQVDGGARVPVFANGRFPRLSLTKVDTNTRYEMGLGSRAIGVPLNLTAVPDEYKVAVEDLPNTYAVKSITFRADEPGVRLVDVRAETLKISQRAIGSGGDRLRVATGAFPITITLTTVPTTSVSIPTPPGRMASASVSVMGSHAFFADNPSDAAVYLSGKPGVLYADGTFVFTGVSAGLQRIVLYAMSVDGPRIAAADVLVSNSPGVRMDGIALHSVPIVPKPVFSAPVLSARATDSQRVLDLASLTVRVLDDATLKPVASANVTLNGIVGSVRRYVGSPNPNLRLADLLPGEYLLTAESSGYTSKTQTVAVGQGDTPFDIQITRAPK